MRIGDLVSISDFPAVVSLANVSAIKEKIFKEAEGGGPLSSESEQALAGYLSEYFTTEPENRAACRSILNSLARVDGPGGAFIVRGVYGSGKSHLLAVVSLLAEFPEAWPIFLAGHPEFNDIARCFHPQRRLLVVQVALDEAGPSSQPLEDTVFETIQRELRARNPGLEVLLAQASHVISVAREFLLPRYANELDELSRPLAASWSELAQKDARAAALVAQQLCARESLPLRLWRSRAEAIGLLEEALRENGYKGIVVLLDELGLFLSAKGKRELDADASFLQFLAQQTSRAPVWLVVTIQRSLEEIGDVDRHTLRQIGDRFEKHALSIAQAREVLSRKLVRKRNPETYAQAIEALHAGLSRQGVPPFSAAALAECYPLNPMALDLLEGLADSVLSKTRTLLQFVQQSASVGGLLDRSHDRLLAPADIFDFFWPRMSDMPEVTAQRAAFSFLESRVRSFAEKQALALSIAKGLVLCSLAGVQWHVRQHAAALAFSDAGAAVQCAQAREALESLRRRGAYVEVSRQEGKWADIYFLDVATDASELLRRRLDEMLAAMTDEDQRVLEFAHAAAGQQGVPLGTLATPRAMAFEWHNTRRWATVQVCDLRGIGEAQLRNAAAVIESPASREDAHLFLGTLYDPEGQQAAWQRAAAAVAGRFAAGLAAWIPRAADGRDIEVLREHAALRIALQDPALKQGRKAAAMRRLASEKAVALEQEAARIVKRLYAEGRVLSVGKQAPIAAPDLEQDWEKVLSELLAPRLAAVFPNFAAVAPARLLAGRQQVNQVINQFLRPDQPVVLPGSSLEAHVRDYLAPLGLARKDGGRWAVSASACTVVEAVLALLSRDEPAAFADLERGLAKSVGLVREQVELALAAMAKAGWVVPCDAFLKPIPFEQLGTPVSEHQPFWARAALIPAEKREAAIELGRALFDRELGELDLPAQQQLWRDACAWAARMKREMPALRQSLEGARNALGHERIMWAATYALLGRAQSFAEKVPEGVPAHEGLSAAIQALGEFDNGAGDLKHLRPVEHFIHEHAAPLAALSAYLKHDALTPLPGSMVEKMKQRLLEALAQGEGLIPEADNISRLAEDFSRSYSKEYCAWHAQVFAASHFRPYVEAKGSDWYQALQALAAAGLDRAGVFASLESALRQAATVQCTGERLPGALRESPLCPDCGLRMGQRLALPDLGDMERRAAQAIGSALAWLKQPEVMQQVDTVLAGRDDNASQGVRALLALPTDAPAADVAPLCTAEAIALLKRVTIKPQATRSTEALKERLRGRISKGEAARAFSQWLDPQQNLKDDDVIEIT
jgi:hypothetical protein